MANIQMILVTLIVIVGTLVEDHVEACSCMPAHPQDLYCSSDFVITAKIRKEFRTNTTKIYKARINKKFKVSEKAEVALKSGRILTSLHGSMCGVQLEVGKTYLMTGRVTGLQAYIGLCGFVKPLKEVTARQRKGFLRIYSQGCDCKITMHSYYPKLADKCEWDKLACQRDFGICLRSPKGQCRWAKSEGLRKCYVKSRKHDVPRHAKLHINYRTMHRRDDMVKTS